ncbi:hypothetical protein N5C80_26645 [Pseudomonas nicosulfuronedens]|uniref:hypothetical protein n=1 Tax=Pseudomonas nicosulfuronedens TaxID=2571105 RepID=UPI00244B8D2F|nr:hypothetical protein [Pseudomonas nicosulfuronedens]MDH1012327.1 hypothetical protein [Pseudomonas nicosulfuronedens]MDH2030496.1 hypothetical protein [Pseudomonas nicosulfuronedens]
MKALLACFGMFTIVVGIVALSLQHDITTVSVSTMECLDHLQLNTSDRECMQTAVDQAKRVEIKAKIIGSALGVQTN